MIDQAEIEIKSGNGGRGAVSFRREKFVPRGGPDGGDGGRGGDVILEADKDIGSLMKYRHQRHYAAADGGRGAGQRKSGKSGADVIVKLPIGTVIRDRDTGDVLADLSQHGERIVAAHGGKGGLGNSHFASSTNQAPRLAQAGAPGETKVLSLELKLIADAGIIGLPNAGKSSLLAAISAARPKVADYPFTTLEPSLGVIDAGGRRWVVADVPGLIEGAHLGKGLGHQFLRHVARTRVLVHLLDGSSPEPVNDMVKINTELLLFDPLLVRKAQLVAVNKIDLPAVKARLPALKELFKAAGHRAIFVSAQSGEGIEGLLAELDAMLQQPVSADAAEAPIKVFRPAPQREKVTVTRDADGYRVESDEFERLVAGSDTNDPEVRRQVLAELWRWGVGRAVRAAKIKPGEKLIIGKLELYW
ncbi:GTPase ObgE [Dehalogenimonas alkenigignens]|uniref:GTPase Obg n=1 Tax=Dehalogenimonas alkenigignens TaxID=1217799 RepID=A0A0W0GGK2_9CHLR|nr:GTPase ObgE [Dehalogenimonas alkenigignens]KTB47678.1 Obg family GTPase CgtA [Dehalogenimonas alkenigignens]PVV84054.1 GTPase ObgE [Dehalogenimonas alkenigignens]